MERHLRSIAKWGKFLGYTFIVFGVIYTLAMLVTIIGIPIGVIQIFLGLYLLRSGKQAENLLYQYSDGALIEMLENYAKFLRLNGILMVVSFVFMVIMFVIMLVSGIMLGDVMSGYNY